MFRHTVIWNPDVEADFIDLWIQSDSETREALTAVANWVDRELIVDPELKGHPTAEPAVFIAAVPNAYARISVVYQVIPADVQVRVMRLNFRRDL